MKKLISGLFFGKDAKINGLIALAVIGTFVLGCNCNKDFNLGNSSSESNSTSVSNTRSETSDDSVPSKTVVEGLVKETIQKFGDAVDSGDFSDLHAYASTDFQSTYTVDEMKTAFKSYTDKKSMVVPLLNKVDDMSAEFKVPPGIRSEKGLKILMAQGEFKTKPYKTRFDFEYVMRGGSWKLLKLVINIP
ncbi:MAG TPA: hypothetical protein PLP21_13220 [Pyrinomonadaceae bacterium]|nr:hypothetical protein [Acidobacteriota bacterium]HQZ97276.1 hypothetical protein [Pyrinomonadaceae bacterium]